MAQWWKGSRPHARLLDYIIICTVSYPWTRIKKKKKPQELILRTISDFPRKKLAPLKITHHVIAYGMPHIVYAYPDSVSTTAMAYNKYLHRVPPGLLPPGHSECSNWQAPCAEGELPAYFPAGFFVAGGPKKNWSISNFNITSVNSLFLNIWIDLRTVARKFWARYLGLLQWGCSMFQVQH